jgi:hypothetical protein
MSELLSIREIIELLVKQDRPFAAENQPPIRTPKKPPQPARPQKIKKSRRPRNLPNLYARKRRCVFL